MLTAPEALHATAEAVAAAAGALCRAADAAGEAKAHPVHALALGRLGKIGACEAVALSCQSVLEMLRGRAEAARPRRRR